MTPKGTQPKYVFGRLNREFQGGHAVAKMQHTERLAHRALVLKEAGKFKAAARVAGKAAAARAGETVKERRARHLDRIDAQKARLAKGITKTKDGRDIATLMKHHQQQVKRETAIIKAKAAKRG